MTEPTATDLSTAADSLEAEYLKVANGEIKPAKMRLEPLVRAVQAMRSASAARSLIATQAPGGLLPCPFCGVAATEPFETESTICRWRCCCSTCDAEGPSGDTYDEVCENWNRRSHVAHTLKGPK